MALAARTVFTARLPFFEGPLDLLLQRVRNEECAPADLPLALLTQQYLEYLDLIQLLDLDLEGASLATAATLIYLKSRALLPETEGDMASDDAEMAIRDPQEELAKRLLASRPYRAAAAYLQTQEAEWSLMFPRACPSPSSDSPPAPQVSLFDLLGALKTVLEKKPVTAAALEVTLDRYTVEDKIAMILDRARGGTSFDQLFVEDHTRLAVITTFLALLELLRQGRVRVEQAKPFGPIQVSQA